MWLQTIGLNCPKRNGSVECKKSVDDKKRNGSVKRKKSVDDKKRSGSVKHKKSADEKRSGVHAKTGLPRTNDYSSINWTASPAQSLSSVWQFSFVIKDIL